MPTSERRSPIPKNPKNPFSVDYNSTPTLSLQFDWKSNIIYQGYFLYKLRQGYGIEYKTIIINNDPFKN
jgi:hypothetical protein